MHKTHLHGTGARHREISPDEEIVGRELAAAPVDFTKPTGLAEPPDEDQGSSNSCTSQAFGYHFWQCTRNQILRNDTYSHTFLPGGGAYLTAPIDFVAQSGALLRSDKYQEPEPETEANMEHVVLATSAAGRLKAYKISRALIHPDINTIASMLEQYQGIIIGVDGNDAGWQNMATPSYNGQDEWGHALYVYDRAKVDGQNALKAKSSWCNSGVKNHFINQSYFNAGGVFEALAVVVKELVMQLVNDSGTWKLVGDKGYWGISDQSALIKAQAISSQVGAGPVTVPQVGVFKTLQVDKNIAISVLVDN